MPESFEITVSEERANIEEITACFCLVQVSVKRLLPNEIQGGEAYSQLLVFLMDKSKFPDADGQFDNAPNFNFNDGKLKFDTNWVNNANENFGSASGFLPKSLFKCV